MKNTTMKKTAIEGLFRKAVGAMVMIALAANAAYGDDSYVESDGTSGISTGYRMKGTSRLEVDFAMVDVGDPDTWNECRIFGTDNTAYEPTLQTCLYATYTAGNGSKYFRVRAKTSASSSRPTKYRSGVDTDRHTVVFDLPNAKMIFMTDGVTNSYGYSDGGTDMTVDAGVSFAGEESTMPLSLFGRWSNAQATTFQSGTKSSDDVTALCAKARIYGVKIYEGDELVRDFVPCLKDGVACFKDLVNGGFIVGEDAAAFTAGGDVPTYADDGYVSTAANADGGKLYFNTGYSMTQKTAVELDCAFAEAFTATSFWGLFESCRSSYRYGFTQTHNYGLRWSCNGTWHDDFTAAFPKTMSGKGIRRKYLLDFNGSSAAVVTSGFTNQTVSFSTETFTTAGTIKLSSGGWGNGEYAPLKIYGCKIWEDGTLVRDFAPYVHNGTPGLRDILTGTFVAASRGSGDTTSALARGGAIVEDAYLESNGTTGLNTGYKMKGTSRLEMDFALTTTNGCAQWRVFGSDTVETALKTYLYIDSNLHWAMREKPLNKYTTAIPDTNRHTAVLDLYKGNVCFTTGNVTNWSGTASSSYDYSTLPEASDPLPILGRYSGNAYALAPKACIYSVRIYESDVLKHEFIPYGGGAVTGLYDTVTGDVISNGSSFAFGGAGQDYGQLKAYIKPGYNDKIDHDESTTLTAYSPGATSYRWLCDGSPVEGGADGTLDVAWTRGGAVQTPGFKVHSYQAIAVFEDFYGVTRESEPSAAANVKCRQMGITLTIK